MKDFKLKAARYLDDVFDSSSRSPHRGTTCMWMRNRRISKLVLAFLVVIVMMWVQLPLADYDTYLFREWLGGGRCWSFGFRPQYPSCCGDSSSGVLDAKARRG
ncbi:hypothetical protein AVEN_191051-1 [Araneus ventricosus]|uniref:Uncharacterized protein n=1 Tax=Araneus ventricosus TaxID=182803 RepID=A0A4Y2AZF2_ARAVE|nr:hypothetical protein AVEN_191051-1 [Araneus ventricosus]